MKRLVWVVLCAVACGDDSTPPRDSSPQLEPEVAVTDESGTAISALTLAQANVGQGSSGVVRVTNHGQGATGPIALAISGAAANDFTLDNSLTTCAARSLGAGESCNIVVLFRPTAVGDRAAMLSVTSTPGGTFAVSLMGHAVMPDLHFNPTSISFGQFELGGSGQTTIELRNDGTGAAPLDAIAVNGTGFTRGASTCGATLAAGSSCDITISATPATLGSLNGDITVTSAGQGYTAGLNMHGARRITIVRQGNGTGTISSAPAGIDCNSTCTALFESAVTLTAVPGASSVITSWSVAGCGSAATCVVPADITPVTVTISFASTASSSLDIVFAGNGTGEVQVRKPGTGILATCFASCSVPAMPGDNVTVRASSPSTFVGYSGACTGTNNCAFAVPSGSTTITATFNKDAKEQWTRFLPGTTPQAAAFDATGNLIVASTTKLTKLGPSGSTIWTLDMNVSALDTGPGDSIYIVLSTGALKKLDAAGAELWSVTAGGVCTRGHAVSVAGDGTVAVRSSGSVSRWTAAGVPLWTKTFTGSNGRCSVATDASGNIGVDVENSNFEATDLHRYAPDGTDLGLQLQVSLQYLSMVSSSPGGSVVACSSGHSEVFLTGVAGFTTGSAATVPNWCAMANTDRAWVYFQQDSATSQPANWRAYRYNSGGQAWMMARNLIIEGPDKYGSTPFHVAGSAAGRIAIVGHYIGITTDTAWVQTYDP